jgi:hypothetical protein
MGEPSHINRPLVFLLILLNYILLWTSITPGLTNLDYHLGQSKYGDASVSGEESFHGSNSAKLSVDSKGNYIRISIYMDEPLPLDDLNLFSMWINPQTGNGKIQLELFMDGNGDDSYDSDSSSDVSLRSLQESWSDMGMSYSQWNELDGFDLEYEKYGDKNFASGSLEDCISKLDGKSVVKFYITIYRDKNTPNTAAFIDYLKFGDEIISFEPLEDEDVKKAPKSVSQGGQITYTITYGNNQLEPVDLVVREDYDPRTIFIEAYPMPDPGTTNVWTFPNLPPGAHGQIVIKMKTSKPTCKAKIEGEVSGLGYASTDGFLSTNSESYQVTNNVAITSGEYNFTDSTTTAVRPIVGSILNYGEHGSGFYHAKEELAYSPASIHLEREINGSRVPVFLNFSKHFMSIHGSWFADLKAENGVRDIRWSDRYYQASLINQSSRVQLGKTLSYLETSSRFVGILDRTTEWPGGFTDQRLAGDFTLQGKARWRQTNKTVSPEKEGLDCCPLIQGET